MCAPGGPAGGTIAAVDAQNGPCLHHHGKRQIIAKRHREARCGPVREIGDVSVARGSSFNAPRQGFKQSQSHWASTHANGSLEAVNGVFRGQAGNEMRRKHAHENPLQIHWIGQNTHVARRYRAAPPLIAQCRKR